MEAVGRQTGAQLFSMGGLRRLLSALPRAACVLIACALPWQDATNPQETPGDDLLDGSTVSAGTFASAPPGDWYRSAPSPKAAMTSARPDVAQQPAPSAETARLAPRFALGLAPSNTPADKHSLAVQLQRELLRVGCYEGEAAGAWTATSRRAAKAFLDAVNAALPSEEPDAVLLALVRVAPGRVCGAGCPAGQTRAAEQCVPDALTAARRPPGAGAFHAASGEMDQRPPAAQAAVPTPVPDEAAPAPPTPVVSAPPKGARPASIKPAMVPSGIGLSVFTQSRLGF
jgi:hypothetical protein